MDAETFVEARSTDPEQPSAIRKSFVVNKYGNHGFDFARLERPGPRRLRASVSDPAVELAKSKMPTQRSAVHRVLRVDEGDVVEREGRLERDVRSTSGDMPRLRAGLACDQGVPGWFVDSFRLSMGEGSKFPDQIRK